MSAKYSQAFWSAVLVAINILGASVVLAEQAAPVDPKVLMEQAEKSYDRQDLEIAMKLYLQAAELNYTPAQVELGKLDDTAQEFETAVGWFIMAAMQGDAAGQYYLAIMYQRGDGIEKDDAKASYWFRRSAAKSYLPALKVLATAYRGGSLGVKIDLEQANAWDAKVARLEAEQRKIIDEKLAALKEQQKKLQEEAAKKAKQ